MHRRPPDTGEPPRPARFRQPIRPIRPSLHGSGGSFRTCWTGVAATQEFRQGCHAASSRHSIGRASGEVHRRPCTQKPTRRRPASRSEYRVGEREICGMSSAGLVRIAVSEAPCGFVKRAIKCTDQVCLWVLRTEKKGRRKPKKRLRSHCFVPSGRRMIAVDAGNAQELPKHR